MTEQQRLILAAIRVLLDAKGVDVQAALDSLEDDEHEIDRYARDRTMLAVKLLQVADDQVAYLAESLALSCPPEYRRFSQFMRPWQGAL